MACPCPRCHQYACDFTPSSSVNLQKFERAHAAFRAVVILTLERSIYTNQDYREYISA
jgi:hypothetical protein